MQIEISDRGIPRPDPLTMCLGPCEGVGCYPEQDQANPAWIEAHAKAHSIEACDGWHFVKCPDCDGSGKRGLP